MRNKISIIGAGNVGASCALWLAQANVADLVLVDLFPDRDDPVEVLAASMQAPVSWTVVNGRVVVREGQLLGSDLLPLLGEAAAVWAFTGQQGGLDLPVEDTAEIGLQFRSGVLGSVHLDYNQRPPAHSLEILGTQGTILWDNADGAVNVYQSPERAGHVPTLQIPVSPGFERNDLFLAEMRHFLALVRGEERPACSLDDGIHALSLALAARRSAETGEIALL